MTLPARKSPSIPGATVARLPVYHRVLANFSAQGVTSVASDELAAACGVSPAKLRKDLSHLGSFGTRGVGYDVSFLSYHIAQELGIMKSRGLVIVGMGNLGRALASYRAFATRGFHVVGLFDNDPSVIGTTFSYGDTDLTVLPISDLPAVVSSRETHIGVITTPADSAQEIADLMTTAGLVSILNFAPTMITVPEGVEVRKVDLAVELQILAFHEHQGSSNSTLASHLEHINIA